MSTKLTVVVLALSTLAPRCVAQEDADAQKARKRDLLRGVKKCESDLDRWLKSATCRECGGTGHVKYTEKESLGRYPVTGAERSQYVDRLGSCQKCSGTGRAVESCDAESNGLRALVSLWEARAEYTAEFKLDSDMAKRLARKVDLAIRGLRRAPSCATKFLLSGPDPGQNPYVLCTATVVDASFEKDGRKVTRLKLGDVDFFVARPLNVGVDWVDNATVTFIGKVLHETQTYTTVTGASRTLRVVELVPITLVD
jgi:hypothetical protein